MLLICDFKALLNSVETRGSATLHPCYAGIDWSG